MTKAEAEQLEQKAEEAAAEIDAARKELEDARKLALAEEDYRDNRWVINIVPMQTTCKRCNAISTIVHVPAGQIRFGAPGGSKRDGPDVTSAVIRAFAKIGWAFLEHRSYCPTCKNMGTQ